MNHFRHLGPS